MTIIAGYRFDQGVLFVADKMRVKITNSGATQGTISNSTKKIRMVRPSIAIATAGLGTLSDAAVMAIRNAIFDPTNQPEWTLDEVINCCQNHFRFLHQQFKRYNPYSYNQMFFTLGGVDPICKKSFLYSFESDLNFDKSENQDLIVRGPSFEENFAKDIIQQNLNQNEGLDHQIVGDIFSSAIKVVSKHSDSVGDSCLAVFVRDSNHLEADL